MPETGCPPLPAAALMLSPISRDITRGPGGVWFHRTIRNCGVGAAAKSRNGALADRRGLCGAQAQDIERSDGPREALQRELADGFRLDDALDQRVHALAHDDLTALGLG